MAEPQKSELGNYEITLPDGSVYEINNATPENVQVLSNIIHEQVKAGNPQLKNVQFPMETVVQNLPADMAFETDRTAKPSSIMTFLKRGASAAPFNFGDEIAAAGNAAIPGMATLENYINSKVDPTAPQQESMYGGSGGFWDAFNKNLQGYQTELQAGTEINPRMDAAGNVAGALAGAKGFGKLFEGGLNVAAKVAPRTVIPAVAAYEAQALARPTLTATATAAPVGAASGYVAGYGAGDTPENRARGGGQGAMAGGALGTGLGIVTTKTAPYLSRLWNAWRGKGSEEEALKQVVQTLQRDGYDVASPSGVLALKTELSRFTNKPVMIADIGRATRARSAAALNAPTAVQRSAIDTVTGRQAGQGQRLVGDVQENVLPSDMALGPTPLNVYSHADDLVASRADNAATLKPPALYEPTTTPPTDIPVYEPPPPPPPAPLRPFEEPPPQYNDNGAPVTDPVVGPLTPPDWQASLDLQPPVAPPVVPPVRTVREDPTAGVERTLAGGPAPYQPPTRRAPLPTIDEGAEAGLRRMLGLPDPPPTGAAFAEAINAPEKRLAAEEAAAAERAAATQREAAAAESARRAERLQELRGMSAERRAAKIAADDAHAKELAFFDNATQQELPLEPGTRRRGVDKFGPPAPTFNPKTPRMVEDPVLNRLFAEDPMAQKALEGAVRLSQGERSRKLILGQDVGDTPEILAGQPLDYRTADYLKRFLDKEVNSLYSRGVSDTFTAAQATEVKNLRDIIRERLRQGNPEYGKYLDQYADDSELMRALEEGQNFGTQAPEQIAAGQAARKPSARDLFRVGAARSLVDTIKGTPDTGVPANRILNSPESREQVAALGLPENNVAALNQAAEQERQMSLLPGMIKPKLASPEAPTLLDAAGKIYNPGSVVSVGRAAARHIADVLFETNNAKVNEALLGKVLNMDKAQQNAIVDELVASGKKEAATRLRRVLKSRSRALKGGMIIGSPVSMQEDRNQ